MQAINSGTYFLTVTGSSGCTDVTSIEVIVPINPTLDMDPTYGFFMQICQSQTLTLSVNSTPSPTGDWNFTGWYDYGGFPLILITTDPQYTINAGGSFIAQAQDPVNGCKLDFLVIITEIPNLNVLTSPNALFLCPGGSATVTALSDGQASFTYLWSTGETTQSISVSNVGSYSVTVTDSKGCTGSTIVEAVNGQALDLKINPAITVFCPGKDNLITVNSQNGTSPFDFSWTTPTGTENTAMINANVQGNYTVTVSDNSACTGTASVFMTQNPDISVSVSPASVVMCNNMPVKLTATASGGAGSTFNYDWISPTGPLTGNIITGTTSGIYVVTGTDKNGCTATESASVTINPDITVSISPNPAIICNNTFVQLTASASGGSNSDFKYDWAIPNGQLNGDVINALLPGIYAVTVTDSENCTAKASIKVVASPGVAVKINPDPAELCIGGFVLLDAVATEGAGSYSYSWITPSDNLTDEKIKAILLGFYSVTVTDANGCTGTGEIEVKNKDHLLVSITPDSVNICNKDSVLLIAFTNEPGLIDYKWSTPIGIQSGDSIATKIGGSYSVTVTSNNGCIGVDSISIKEALNPIFSISSSSNEFCKSDSILLNVITTNTDILNYVWDTPAGSESGKTIKVSSEGYFIVTVKNTSGCVATDSIYLNQSPEVEVSITPDSAIFCKSSNIELTASSKSTGLLSYKWATPAGQQSGNIINASLEGNYIVTIQNAFGCEASDTIFVKQTDTLSVNISPDTASICPGNFVNLSANSNGSGLLSYNWSTPAGTATGKDILVSEIGIYTVTVISSKGCSGTATLKLKQAPPVPLSIVPQNPTICEGKSINLTANSIGTNLSFNWNTPFGNLMGQSISANIPGTYSLTVTDNSGCTGIDSIIISEYPALIIQIGPYPASFCNTGTVILNANLIKNGTGPFTYQWDAPLGSGNEISFNANTVGNYSVTVTDNNGCTGTDTTLVTQSNKLNLSFDPVMPGICPNGSIDISVKVNGGQEPYIYAWNSPLGSFSSALINTATPGSYQLTVTDINACEGEGEIAVLEFSEPLINIPLELGFCPGKDVSIEANVQDTLLPFKYLWNTPDGNSDMPFFVANTAGNYYLTVTNAEGCSATASTNVDKWETPSIKYSPFPVEFCNSKSVEVTADATIGLAPFSFKWQGPSINSTGSSLTVLEAGSYSLTVTDAHGCTSDISLTAGESAGLVVSVNTDPNILCGVTPFTLLPNVSGGVLPYNYDWQTPSGLETGASLITNDFGNYTLTVTDSKGCTGFSTLKVLADSLSVVLDKTDPGCIAIKAGSITLLSASNPSFPMQLVLNNNPPIIVNTLPYLLNTLPAGMYNINIIGNNGCKQSLNLELSEPSIPTLNLGADVTIFLGESYAIIPVANFIIDSIRWTNKNSLICSPGCLEPTAQPVVSTSYKATAYSKDGCKAVDDISIYVVEKESVFVPNSFSPNGDGFNDKWVIFADNSVNQIKKMYVYDRWGESVFIQNDFPANDPAFGWDGRFKGANMNTGVFVYYLQVEFNDGRIKEFKGDVNLIR
ncbi:MAG TPA: gliding motility-associated C-terminal domain-containing protein [Saprospiraceae bacterium]|nr:gliding motility-associated C-terminal domain-containing protein [Saprospiraceae bacterium]